MPKKLDPLLWYVHEPDSMSVKQEWKYAVSIASPPM